MAVLEPQVRGQPVSILTEIDDGKLSIGAKRNRLLDRADRKYLAFVDDDDMVDPAYVSLVLNAIHTHNEPDCIGMCGYIMKNGQRTWQFRHSITVTNWCRDKKARIYFRTPNHLNPVKSVFAKQLQFPETNRGEDRAYSDAIRKYLHSEAFIEHPIYYYRMGNKG
jgi:glycosyltransferase involved in cell wall biosynthesis